MKNHREICEALLAGETLVYAGGSSEAFINDNDNLNGSWGFSSPEKWSIRPRLVVLFGFIYCDGVPSITTFPTEDEAVSYFRDHGCGQITKFQQVTE